MTKSQCCADTPAPVKSSLRMKIVGDELLYTLNGVTGRLDISGLVGGGSSAIVPLVATQGQTIFTNAIPNGAVVAFLNINGLSLQPGNGYTVIGRTITWIGAYALSPTDTMFIELK